MASLKNVDASEAHASYFFRKGTFQIKVQNKLNAAFRELNREKLINLPGGPEQQLFRIEYTAEMTAFSCNVSGCRVVCEAFNPSAVRLALVEYVRAPF